MIAMPSAIENHVLRHRIENGTATDRFAERFAEMAQTGVADFGRCLGDVVTAAAQKFGRAFHAHVAQILRDREADFARENPAQIKWAASNFLAEHLQRRRVRQIAREQFFRALDPIARDPFLAHAKKFRVLRHEKENAP